MTFGRIFGDLSLAEARKRILRRLVCEKHSALLSVGLFFTKSLENNKKCANRKTVKNEVNQPT